MKTSDFLFLAVATALLAPFFLCPALYDAYTACNAAHPYLLAFLKFGILSTAGEAIGLRIKTGRYNEPGFGLLPRAVVWGFLGIWIAAAMKVFASGVPLFAQTLGLEEVPAAMRGALSPMKLLGALLVVPAK